MAAHPRRVDFGYFVRPSEETVTGSLRVEPCLGYLAQTSRGALLIDTGMGGDDDVDAHYRPQRQSLRAALSKADMRPDDIRFVVNCHLHLDHCGGNPLLPKRPIFVQRAELSAARITLRYTLPELIDAPGLHYEQLDGETEVLPGVLIVPPPATPTVTHLWCCVPMTAASSSQDRPTRAPAPTAPMR